MSTGDELFKQIVPQLERGLELNSVVASVGTGGTLTGISRALKKQNINHTMVSVSPAEQVSGHYGPQNGLPKIAGSGGMGFGRNQYFLKEHLKDIVKYSVNYQDALMASEQLSKFIGINIGTSAAANWLTAKDIARSLSTDKFVVTVIPSLALPHEIELGKNLMDHM